MLFVTQTNQPVDKHSYAELIPIVYDRFHKPITDQPLPVHIFDTGSSGNSVYIKNMHILIDLGLPYKRYKEYSEVFFNDVDYIILTHEHGDHINPATLLRVLKTFPHVRVIIPKNMWTTINSEGWSHRIRQDELRQYCQPGNNRFYLAEEHMLITRDLINVHFKPHLTRHGDITNIAIELTTPQLDAHILYASDLDTLDPDETGVTQGLPHYSDNPFNLIFLEANYDTELLNEALRINPYDAKAKGNLRHISEQEAFAYVERYLTDDGAFIPLHASSQFGTLIQK